VHLGETFGVTPNPNATRPATVAAIGNPYGGMQGPAVAPHGVWARRALATELKSGSNAGVVGKVASAGIPGGTGTARRACGRQGGFRGYSADEAAVRRSPDAEGLPRLSRPTSK
jgi:hypothetical protein